MLENKETFYCDAIVLDETAQHILLGTNWLVKHKVSINPEKGTTKAVTNGENITIPISSI